MNGSSVDLGPLFPLRRPTTAEMVSLPPVDRKGDKLHSGSFASRKMLSGIQSSRKPSPVTPAPGGNRLRKETQEHNVMLRDTRQWGSADHHRPSHGC